MKKLLSKLLICTFLLNMAIILPYPEKANDKNGKLKYYDSIALINAKGELLESLSWLLPIIGLLASFGAIAGVMAWWVTGPSKGLLATAKNGEIPPFLAHVNKKGIQIHILLIQGIIVSILTSLYLIMDNVSVAFFLLSAMTITLYLVMYFLLFLAGIKLRYSKPDIKRPYKIPGGNFGMWIVAGIGIIAVVFAFIVGFFPPTELKITTPILYVSFVIIGFLVFSGSAIIIHALKKPQWLQHPKVTSKEIKANGD